jgi:hypothetical protein
MGKIYCVSMGAARHHYSTQEEAVRRAMQLAALCEPSIEIIVTKRWTKSWMTRAVMAAHINGENLPNGSRVARRDPEMGEFELLARLRGLGDKNTSIKTQAEGRRPALRRDGFPV